MVLTISLGTLVLCGIGWLVFNMDKFVDWLDRISESTRQRLVKRP